jgi:predicted phage terminase large subunit-like protein
MRSARLWKSKRVVTLLLLVLASVGYSSTYHIMDATQPQQLSSQHLRANMGDAATLVVPQQAELRPQEGPQEDFFCSKADIVIYGGAAFSGKSMAILMEAVRHVDKPGFGCVIFRRTYPEIKMQGGLWDKAMEIYPQLGATPRESDLSFTWPSGARVKFAHMQHEKNRFDWQGSQIPLVEFDELPHFTETQFWYLVSRNRLPRAIGVRPYLRATCNPEPGSWVAALLDWWIGKDGFPIEGRSGKLRYFIRDGDNIQWADHPHELSRPEDAKSLTFIAAKIDDNKIGVEMDPGYRATLMALPLYERMVLLGGNWKVRRSKGMRFRREWFGETLETLPPGRARRVRYWDRASTEESPINKSPDRTAGVKVSKYGDLYVIEDCTSFRKTPHEVRKHIAICASQDNAPKDCELWLEQDPASAGKAERADLATGLTRYAPRFAKPTGSKWIRSAPASAAAESGLVKVLRGAWNDEFFRELEDFVDEQQIDVNVSTDYHDDRVDAFTGAFNVLSRGQTVGVF